ncbi:MAG TPA: hypothetical protein VFV37_06120 [Luteibaculaceae bacterium]|nr:hypothetical protein [Luteibaculaceae bacterium]
MPKIIAFTLLVLSTLIGYSQENIVYVYGYVKDDNTGLKLADVKVNLIQDGKPTSSNTTTTTGKFEIDLSFEHDYELHFVKAGYVEKFIKIDTRNVPKDNQVGGFGFDVDISLFATIEGVNFDLFKQPVGIAKYSAAVGEITFDYEYTKAFLAKIEELKRSYLKKRKEEEDRLKAEQLAADQARLKQQQFETLVKEGDQQMAASSYNNAIFKYADALNLLPGTKYVEDKLAAAKKALDEQNLLKEKEQRYKESIAAADKAFLDKNYKAAIDQYNAALNHKPNEAYPKTRIQDAKTALDELAKKEATEKTYKQAIARADSLFAKQLFTESIKSYEQALVAKPGETYPQQRITDAKLKLDEISKQKALDERFTAAMNNGNTALTEKRYTDAITFFKEASGIKPEETLPKKKILEAQGYLDAAEKERQQQLAFDNAIKQGDERLSKDEFQAAIDLFNQALTIKPNDALAKAKLAESQKKLAQAKQQAELDQNYTAAITQGEKDLSAKNYTAALANYNRAAALKPNEQLPKDKIGQLNSLIAEDQKKADLEKRYQASMAKAQTAQTAGQLLAAKAAFEEALNAKPKDPDAETKLAAVVALISEKEQKDKLEASYKQEIQRADSLFKAAQFENSIAGYQKALDLKPAETYPANKINEARGKLSELAENQRKKEQYNKAIAEADGYFGQAKYKDAIASYKTAGFLIPTETYPKTKIAEAEAKLAEIAKKEQADKQYADLINKADSLFTAKKWDEALAGYQLASSVKPAEQYPKDQVIKVKEQLNALAQQKAIEEQYSSLIAKADASMKTKSWDAAEKSYQQAAGIKPTEKYPKDQLDLIASERAAEARAKKLADDYTNAVNKADSAFNKADYSNAIGMYEKAAEIKPEATYPKERIKAAEAKIAELKKKAELDDQFQALVQKGDGQMENNTFEAAIQSFTEALALKPTDAGAKAKLNDAKAKQQAFIKNAAQNAKYDSLMASGSAQLDLKQYEVALKSFTQASGIKPTEQLPKDKIQEINAILKSIADEKANLGKYNTAIQKADSLFGKSNWTASIKAYENAAVIRPSETYPSQQIALANDKLKDEAAKKAKDDEAFANLMKQGEGQMAESQFDASIASFTDALAIRPNDAIAKAKLAEAKQKKLDKDKSDALDQKYMASIKKADDLFKDDLFVEALAAYREASVLKPAETYPKNQMALCNERLEEAKKLADAETKYKSLISKADADMNALNFESAKKGYQSALAIKPEEVYPKNQIEICDTRLAEINEIKQRESNYKKAVAAGDSLFKLTNYTKAIDAFEDALSIKPNEAYPKQQIAAVNEAIKKQNEREASKMAYQQAVASADSLFKLEQWQNSIDGYKKAQLISASETYPAKQITAAQLKLDEIEKVRLAKEAKYSGFIKQADSAFAKQAYMVAKNYYAEAIKVKPKETYPKDQMDACDAKLDELAKLEADKAAKKELEEITKPVVEEKDPTIVSFKDATSFQGVKPEPQKEAAKPAEPAPTNKPKVTYRTSTEGDLDEFRKQLGLNYPEGLTKEEFLEGSKRIYRTIYVKDKLGDEYLKVVFTNGLGTFYFKNGDSSGLTSVEYERIIKTLK